MRLESERLARAQEALREAGLDALWISSPPNVRYLSGFSDPADGKVLLSADQATLLTDARYSVQVADEVALPIVIARSPETLRRAAESVAGLRVGFEAAHLSVAALGELQEHWRAELVPTQGLIEGLRLVKDAREIAAIRRAQAVADAAYLEVLPQIVPGARETDIALALELAMRRGGADSAAFSITAASGPRGARPHGGASERVMQSGELITLDFGAIVDGYHSDMTRTLALGEVGDELRRLYSAVLEAEETALAAVRPGARTADLDAIARGVLERHHLAEYFTHSLGHGVGLEIHEEPGLRATSEEVLTAGMVITIEPGVYLPGVGGVRIEDLVLVTENGYEVLSGSEKVRL